MANEILHNHQGAWIKVEDVQDAAQKSQARIDELTAEVERLKGQLAAVVQPPASAPS